MLPLGRRLNSAGGVRAFSTALRRPLAPLRTVSTLPSLRRSSGLAAGQRDPAELDQITRLPNGLRVATEALPGHFAAVGVYVEGGSRFEPPELSGCSHIMDRLAFKSTKTRSIDDMQGVLQEMGGTYMCSSSREAVMYQAAAFNQDIERMTEVLADTIINPQITEDEVETQKLTAEYEIEQIWGKPDMILPELAHMAAFRDNTLGNALLCPAERLPLINSDVMKQYRNAFYQPERTVVAFAGVAHEEALRIVERHFGDWKSATPGESAVSTGTLDGIFKSLFAGSGGQPPLISTPAHYTGGSIVLPTTAKVPDYTHCFIAFEGLPISDPDVYALAVLQLIIGSGSSFSAGGPGKGMFARAFTKVLNRYRWIDSFMSFNHSYSDSGLFGVSASVEHRAANVVAEVICQELALTMHSGAGGITQLEVDNAKRQLRSSLLMNLESRMIQVEDLGRQVQVHGRKVGVQEMCESISALSVDDITRVAQRVMKGAVVNVGEGSGRPTVVLHGPNVENIGDVFACCDKYGLGRGAPDKGYTRGGK
ncbi:hypothetical protein SAICODRAFT_89261 [Saitoella complicata NRRL Y-17804]|nr:uncharacterized protein SAICODRAFT_89261 [Saitoella complicata NRRL Y-17804]ODQ55085.1 hypothetical protein SAICODRAFT_89261 [Saitoella complicata NRRL Y-17804]